MHETTPLKEETLREPLRNPYGTLQALQPQKTLKLSCTKHPETRKTIRKPYKILKQCNPQALRQPTQQSPKP